MHAQSVESRPCFPYDVVPCCGALLRFHLPLDVLGNVVEHDSEPLALSNVPGLKNSSAGASTSDAQGRFRLKRYGDPRLRDVARPSIMEQWQHEYLAKLIV